VPWRTSPRPCVKRPMPASTPKVPAVSLRAMSVAHPRAAPAATRRPHLRRCA
jgi:hypothetical protein